MQSAASAATGQASSNSQGNEHPGANNKPGSLQIAAMHRWCLRASIDGEVGLEEFP